MRGILIPSHGHPHPSHTYSLSRGLAQHKCCTCAFPTPPWLQSNLGITEAPSPAARFASRHRAGYSVVPLSLAFGYSFSCVSCYFSPSLKSKGLQGAPTADAETYLLGRGKCSSLSQAGGWPRGGGVSAGRNRPWQQVGLGPSARSRSRRLFSGPGVQWP